MRGEAFEGLEGKLPDKGVRENAGAVRHQKEHAREWRDQINTYFYRRAVLRMKRRKIF